MSELHPVDQRTAAWFALRRGRPTTSNFGKVITPLGEPTKGEKPREYMHKLIAERLLEQNFEEDVKGPWVEHGVMCEPKALKLFEETHKVILRKIGFVTTEYGPFAKGRLGSSPDSFVEGSARAVEVKCRAPWNHIGYILAKARDEVPETNYRQQVQGHILVGEGRWESVEFFAYHPQMPPVHIRTYPDRDFLEKLTDRLWAFCDKLDIETRRARDYGAYFPTEFAVNEAIVDE